MAQKNWLIRTKNKQILGPATKDKIIELIQKGSLTSDDEITSGNGYWFWIREQDLIDKYLYGDLPQSFNPISEAEDVLTAQNTPDGITANVSATPEPKPVQAAAPEPSPSDNQMPSDDDLAYPDDDDLAYPDMGGEEEAVPKAADLDYPEVDTEDKTDPALAMSEDSLSLEEPTMDLAVEEPAAAPAPAMEMAGEEELDGEDSYILPSEEDLEYPEGFDEPYESEEVEIEEEMVMEAAPEMEAEMPEEPVPSFDEPIPSEEIEEVPLAPEEAETFEEPESFEEPPRPVKKTKKKKKKTRRKKKLVTERKGNDRYLFVIGLLIVVAIGFVIYYYKEILNKPLPIVGIAEVKAQTLQNLSKKKSY